MADSTGLKPGWQLVRFGDVVRQVKDKIDPEKSGLERYVAGEHMDTDDLKIRRWGEIGSGYLGPAFHMRFKPGQVLYGSRRTYLRKVAVPDFEGICANTTFVLESKNPKVLLPELLPFIMQTERFHEHSIKQSRGSVNPYVNFSDIDWFEFALPAIEEQKRITRILQAFLNVIEKEQNIIAKAETVLKSQQKHYFLTIQDKRKIQLGSVADVQNGTTPSRKKSLYWNGNIPWLPTGKVNERLIYKSEEHITEKALNECSLNVIPKGSTLVAMIGQGQTRGKVAKLEIDACINQNFSAITPSKEIDEWFVFYQLESNYEKLRAWSHGSNQHALNCTIIKAFPVWIPTLEEQKAISSQMNQVDSVIKSNKVRLNKTKNFYYLLQNKILFELKIL